MSQLINNFDQKISQTFKELYDSSISAEYESQIDKPWQSVKTVKTHFFWGDKSGGKSTSMEETAVKYYKAGLNIWHVWSARSYENWFWPINLNCRKKWKKLSELPDELQEELGGRLHCDCHEGIPSVLIFPEYIQVDVNSVAKFNGRIWKNMEEYSEAVQNGWIGPEISKEEKIALKEGKLRKPEYLQPEIDLIKIAYVTIPTNEENRETFKKQWIKITLEARQENRVVLVTPQIFEGDKDKFLVVGEIFKLIPDIADEYFMELTPEEVGKMRGLSVPVPKEGIPELGIQPWTLRERGWNKIVLVANELGTIAPNNKYSRQVESKNAKRPIVDTIPEVRHMGSGVYFMGDLQNPDDLNSSVRPQADSVIVKRATEELLGTEFKGFFNKIAELRRKEFAKYDFDIDSPDKEKFVPNEIRKLVNSKYPRIEELPKNKGYVVFRNGEFFLETFDMPPFHHREEGRSFRQTTGIVWSLNKKKLVQTQGEAKEKNGKSSAKNDKKETERMILDKLVELKLQGMDWEKGRDKIIEMVEKGQLGPEYGATNITKLEGKSISKKVRRVQELVERLDGSKNNVKLAN